MTIRPPPPSGMYEVPDGGSTLAAEPRKVIRQAYVVCDEAVFLSFSRPLDDATTDLHEVLDRCEIKLHVPSPTEQAAVNQLKRVTGLNFFSVDYVTQVEGVIVLEINPLTSWSWLPSEIGASVSESILRLSFRTERKIK